MCNLQFKKKLLCVTVKCNEMYSGPHVSTCQDLKNKLCFFKLKKSRGLGICQVNRHKHACYYILEHMLASHMN